MGSKVFRLCLENFPIIQAKEYKEVFDTFELFLYLNKIFNEIDKRKIKQNFKLLKYSI